MRPASIIPKSFEKVKQRQTLVIDFFTQDVFECLISLSTFSISKKTKMCIGNTATTRWGWAHRIKRRRGAVDSELGTNSSGEQDRRWRRESHRIEGALGDCVAGFTEQPPSYERGPVLPAYEEVVRRQRI